GLRQLVTYLGVSEANMQMGHMRFEPNINLHITGGGRRVATPIVELKNLNSFRAVERSIAFEQRRQLAEWEQTHRTLEMAGKTTRGYNDESGETFIQREKEEAQDYRYFPEPDLVVVEPEPEWVDQLRRELPELPLAKKNRFVNELGLSDYDAGAVTATAEMARYYEAVAEGSGAAKAAANWVTQGLSRELNERGLVIERDEDFPVPPDRLAELVKAVESGAITKSSGDKVLRGMIDSGRTAGEIIEAEGLAQTSDSDELGRWIEEAIAANPGPVADFKAGKRKALGRIMGHIMKASRGKANPRTVTEMLEKRLAEQGP
ncbi:MAG: Asp-tRNA(Asn)/Glu-tRNA(Gln) amidotransferase GatCAB subunit B, partial [Anaerolineaceae bacterium]|nr:Asp-tRNA(Asn)/Glu-tRNA(Gln) amidotransferase GatCAB subunit B [Anaerolineaceae bacterium]